MATSDMHSGKFEAELSPDELAAIESFKTDVCGHKEVDPEGEHDWFSMSLGFFMARGISYARAFEIALWARYIKQYWEVED